MNQYESLNKKIRWTCKLCVNSQSLKKKINEWMKPMYIQDEGHVCIRDRNTVTEISRDRDKETETDRKKITFSFQLLWRRAALTEIESYKGLCTLNHPHQILLDIKQGLKNKLRHIIEQKIDSKCAALTWKCLGERLRKRKYRRKERKLLISYSLKPSCGEGNGNVILWVTLTIV